MNVLESRDGLVDELFRTVFFVRLEETGREVEYHGDGHTTTAARETHGRDETSR